MWRPEGWSIQAIIEGVTGERTSVTHILNFYTADGEERKEIALDKFMEATADAMLEAATERVFTEIGRIFHREKGAGSMGALGIAVAEVKSELLGERDETP